VTQPRAPRSEAEFATLQAFEQCYRQVTSPVLRAIELRVCGCDYGGTSWTTRAEADRIGAELRLSPGKALLDVGAGAGWPSLYLTKRSGCSAVLVDQPPEGLRVAAARIADDGLRDRCRVVRGDGVALPFEDACFDAVSHSDVLCCLPNKVGVLRECRRVIRNAGRSAFTVIYTPPGLSASDHAAALAAGPSFVQTETPYETMLVEGGWRQLSRADLTPEFAATLRRVIDARLAQADELVALIGREEHEAFVAAMRQKLEVVDRRLLERAMFVAEPV
jgi:ubiquinone/menaquinone biosynthesis C-methylase UbiE